MFWPNPSKHINLNKMKKLLIISTGLIFALTSCNQAEIERLESERIESIKSSGEKNVKINHLLEELNYIADNLQVIREKQGVYETLTVEDNAEIELMLKPEDKVKSEIEMIDFLMSNNLDRIASLEKSLEKSGEEMEGVKKLLSSFKMDVKDKGEEIQALKETIVKMEGDYANLMDEHMNSQLYVELQAKQLEMRDNELNKVFFVYGTKAELMENQIIQKKGGILGLGSVNSVKDDFNKDYFTTVDLRDLDKIPLEGKKIEILTEHPANSYEIVKNDEELISEIKINNKDAFWEGSQYLVMVTKWYSCLLVTFKKEEYSP